jgi:hypothetical protein
MNTPLLAQVERVPPLRSADPRVRVQIRPGKWAWIYPGQLRVNTGASSSRFLIKDKPMAAPASMPVTHPCREYRLPGGRPIGGALIRLLRYLYALPACSVLPRSIDIATDLQISSQSVKEAYASLALAEAIETETRQMRGVQRRRVVVLVETGRALRSAGADPSWLP